MHCPNCRLANTSTTRFCTGCGAVLVESAPGGGRRRVLRPWGLRRRAPQTESPAMPDLAAALAAARRARGWPARKLGVFFAGGVAVTAVAGTLVYPYAPWQEPAKSEPPVVIVETALAVPAMREVQLSAPALAEPLIAPPRAPARPDSGPRNVTRAMPALIAPLPIPEVQPAAVEPQIVEARPPPAPVAVPSPPVDRFEPLRDALRACGARDGLFDRAMCEQRARIDHCGGHWGTVPPCPSGRNEHTP